MSEDKRTPESAIAIKLVTIWTGHLPFLAAAMKIRLW
jgi:hypothetical protein